MSPDKDRVLRGGVSPRVQGVVGTQRRKAAWRKGPSSCVMSKVRTSPGLLQTKGKARAKTQAGPDKGVRGAMGRDEAGPDRMRTCTWSISEPFFFTRDPSTLQGVKCPCFGCTKAP